jgi:hypothetical protein
VPPVDVLEQVVQSQGHEDKTRLADEFARDAKAKERLGSRDVAGVTPAFAWTISLPGTYPMAKKPTIDTSTYSKPANLPGLRVELIFPPLL